MDASVRSDVLRLALLFTIAACGTSDARPLLGPTKAKAPAAEWRRQLLAVPTYHARFTFEHKDEGTSVYVSGTTSSDPAHRKLRVATDETFTDGKESYKRSVELTIDGTRARLVGSNAEGARHTSVAALPAVRDPDVPFGDVSVSMAGFTFGGDLRQTILDCLTDATLTPAGRGEWTVTRDADKAFAVMVRRHDTSLVDLHGGPGSPVDMCRGVTFLAAPDGTLRGMRRAAGRRTGDFVTITFEMFTGVDASFEITDASLAGATRLDPGLTFQRTAVDKLVANPDALAAVRANL